MQQTPVSLRAFHLGFICLSIVLSTATGLYFLMPEGTSALEKILGFSSLGASLALIVYGWKFVEKWKRETR